MAYALMIAVLLFVALLVVASPLLAVIVVIPLFLIYLGAMAVMRRSDEQRGTDEVPSESSGPNGKSPDEPDGDRDIGPLPPA